MSNILPLRYQQGKRQTTVMEEMEKWREQRKYIHDQPTLHEDVFVTAQDKPAKQTVNQNPGKSVNNRMRVDSTIKTDQYYQSSIQVRHQNEEHTHYYHY